MPTKTFMIEPTGYVKIYLRRYHGISDEEKCPGRYGYHNAKAYVGKEQARYRKLKDTKFPYIVLANKGSKFKKKYPHSHSKWPSICDYCGYEFTKEDNWQIFVEAEYCRVDTGETFPLNEAPPGSMYFAKWMSGHPKYGDKGPLHAVCPNGSIWNIDGRATNCTMKDDDKHFCWIRHGEPPEITVDKNGVTCAAGAGSILSGNYHGFLRNGYFTDNM